MSVRNASVPSATPGRCHRLAKRAWLLAPLLALAAGTASAARLEVQGGRSYMDSHPTTTLFVEGVFAAHPLGTTRFSWAPDVSMGWIDGRHLSRYDGAHYTPHQAVWLAAGGVRLQRGDAGDWYRHLFFSEQLAVQNRRSLALSSDYEFVSSVGWQGRYFSFQLRHISNAGLHGPNRGETMALLGAGFTF